MNGSVERSCKDREDPAIRFWFKDLVETGRKKIEIPDDLMVAEEREGREKKRPGVIGITCTIEPAHRTTASSDGTGGTFSHVFFFSFEFEAGEGEV